MGKRKRILREICITSVFELLIYEIACIGLCMDKHNNIISNIFFVCFFFYMVWYQNAKMYAKPLHGEMKRCYPKRVFCVFFFQRIKHQHAKYLVKYPIQENKTMLPNKCLLSDLRTRTLKRLYRTLYG